jgi:hypothetical protein
MCNNNTLYSKHCIKMIVYARRHVQCISALNCYVKIHRGRLHGQVDVGLSVVTYKKKTARIDIDAEDTIYHLKVNVVSFF